MKEISIKLKKYTKDYLSKNSDKVFQNRELVVEVDNSVPDDPVYRFKLGDGVSPYKELKYISSLYSLYPSFCICNESYTNKINLSLDGDDYVHS
jgi:hypothetical protein